jgi:hypothetical protein
MSKEHAERNLWSIRVFIGALYILFVKRGRSGGRGVLEALNFLSKEIWSKILGPTGMIIED